MMWREIFVFELKYRLNRPVTYIYFTILFILSFAVMALMGADLKSISISMGGSGGLVYINSPYSITQMISGIGLIGFFITVAIIHNSVCRDFQHKTHDIFFTKPISKFDYLTARFAGALLITLIVHLGIGAGLYLATLMPWMNPEILGTSYFMAYFNSYIYLLLPNMIFTGAIVFALASLTRSSLAAQASAVLFFLAYSFSGSLLLDIENKLMASLIDPMGTIAIGNQTEYWTVNEKNSQLISMSSHLLYNRLLWLAVGLGIFFAFFKAFKLSSLNPTLKLFSFVSGTKEIHEVSGEAKTIKTSVKREFSTSNNFRILFRLSKIEFLSTIKNLYFLLIILFGIILSFSGTMVMGSMYGTATYPVTYMVLESLGTQGLIILIITIVYSGELIWRDRNNKIDQLMDATPVPDWVFFFSKFVTINLLIILILLLTMAAGITIQALQGYYKFELFLYVKELFGMKFIHASLLVAVALFIQVMVNNKFMGFVITILFMVLLGYFSSIGLEHPMFKFSSDLGYLYSDMNGYGHHLSSYFSYKIYWGMFSILLILTALLFWIRGKDTWFKIRLKTVGRIGSQPDFYSVGAAVILVFLLSGTWIFYNQNILNEYLPQSKSILRSIDFEKKYKIYEDSPQPRIISSKIELDLFPEERSYRVKGRYVLKNKTSSPIDSLLVSWSKTLQGEINLSEANELVHEDKDHNFFIYRLAKPLLPGDNLVFDFTLAYESKGFMGSTSIVYNGSFFSNLGNFPSFGYNDIVELKDPDVRRKHGLPPADRMANIDDMNARMNNYISNDADWIEFEAIISTSNDQIAIAPGYLQNEWTNNGRRYFHYKMDAKMLNFYSFNSARYEVFRDFYNDIKLEIYYHKGHEYNLERMMKSIKMSLEYFGTNFSPYQHKQVRIIEFPRYSKFAQSFSNTIPYSESMGFIAKVKDEDDIDYVFYVTAHEMAHQWWAHQVIGANVQGSEMLSESLSQYGALMVMEQEYGKPYMRKFMEYELNKYLKGRGFERHKEQPLMLVEGQHYIHYHKGSLVFYALREYLGERNLNSFLQQFIKENAYQEPPYTNARAFVDMLRNFTPDSMQYLITDMFEKIVLYDNKMLSATYQQMADGTYKTIVTLNTKKLEVDGKGQETEVEFNDWIELGIYDSEIKTAKALGKELYRGMHRLSAGESTITIITDEKPVGVSIDPFLLLVDRNIMDNSVVARKLAL